MISVNNKLMLEAYKGARKIEGQGTGFTTIKQKNTIIGLKVLADGKIPLGREQFMEVKKGQTVYFQEEILFSSEWSKKTYNIEGSEDRFVIGEALQVVFVE